MGGGKVLMSNLANLISSPANINNFELESSGCLSECGKGPNVEISSNTKGSKLFRGIRDNDEVEAMLEKCGASIPPLLMAACNIMARADKTFKADEKEALLASVIAALEKDETVGQSSKALVSCLVKRADARLSYSPPHVEGALSDVKHAASIEPNNGLVWRVLAEVEEKKGNIDAAIKAFSQCATIEPSFRGKFNNEIARLKNLQA